MPAAATPTLHSTSSIPLWPITTRQSGSTRTTRTFANRGDVYSRKGETDRGLTDIEHALQLDPGYVLARRLHGVPLSYRGQDEKALADFDALLKANPKDVRALKDRGGVLVRMGQYQRTIEDLDKALTLEPRRISALLNRGAAHNGLRQFDQAVADLDEAIRLDPNHAGAYTNRGLARFALSQFDQAIADLSEAVRLDPKSTLARFNRAEVYARLRLYESAVDDYDATIRLAPQFAPAYVGLGHALEQVGKSDQAIEEYSMALRLVPSDRGVYCSRGNARRIRRDWGGAVADFTSALDLDPRDADAHVSRGWARLIAGRDGATTTPRLPQPATRRQERCLHGDPRRTWQSGEQAATPRPTPFSTPGSPTCRRPKIGPPPSSATSSTRPPHPTSSPPPVTMPRPARPMRSPASTSSSRASKTMPSNISARSKTTLPPAPWRSNWPARPCSASKARLRCRNRFPEDRALTRPSRPTKLGRSCRAIGIGTEIGTETRGEPTMRILAGTLLTIATSLFLNALSATAAEGPQTYPLWPDGAPGALGKETGDEFHPGDVPTITVYPPDPAKANGAAVVICPGGGYGFLATEHEGKDVAVWLNTLGVTGVVLKYRLGPRYHHPVMLEDAQRASVPFGPGRRVGIDPSRVAVLGFSAGGHLASTLITHFDTGLPDAPIPSTI